MAGIKSPLSDVATGLGVLLLWWDHSFHSMVIDLAAEALRHADMNSPRLELNKWTQREPLR